MFVIEFVPWTGTAPVIDYNLYYQPLSYQYNATSYTTLSAFKLATGQEAHGQEANPQFIIGTYVPLQGSLACNMSSTGGYVGALACAEEICTESWVDNSTACTGMNHTILYYDANACGTTEELPADNGTVENCEPIYINTPTHNEYIQRYLNLTWTTNYTDVSYWNATIQNKSLLMTGETTLDASGGTWGAECDSWVISEEHKAIASNVTTTGNRQIERIAGQCYSGESYSASVGLKIHYLDGTSTGLIILVGVGCEHVPTTWNYYHTQPEKQVSYVETYTCYNHDHGTNSITNTLYYYNNITGNENYYDLYGGNTLGGLAIGYYNLTLSAYNSSGYMGEAYRTIYIASDAGVNITATNYTTGAAITTFNVTITDVTASTEYTAGTTTGTIETDAILGHTYRITPTDSGLSASNNLFTVENTTETHNILLYEKYMKYLSFDQATTGTIYGTNEDGAFITQRFNNTDNLSIVRPPLSTSVLNIV